MNNVLFFWALFALTMLFAELISPGLLYCASFALGALAAGLVQWIGLSLTAQFAMFLFVSFIVVLMLQYLVGRLTSGAEYVSNVHALVGKKAIVEVTIQPYERGSIRINGQQWSARSEKKESNKILAAGSIVTIVKIIGCHAVVTPEQK